MTVPLHKVTELQQSKKLKAHNLASDEGDSHDEVADHFYHMQHTANLFCSFTLLICVCN